MEGGREGWREREREEGRRERNKTQRRRRRAAGGRGSKGQRELTFKRKKKCGTY
jgi:hypothetical protein